MEGWMEGWREGGTEGLRERKYESESESVRATHVLQKLIDLVVRLALIRHHSILVGPRLHLASLIIDILF